jgi:hypothetical protein
MRPQKYIEEHFEGMFIKKGSRIMFFRIGLKAKELPTLSALERQRGATPTVADRESNGRSNIDMGEISLAGQGDDGGGCLR